jgi:hypothetical protein
MVSARSKSARAVEFTGCLEQQRPVVVGKTDIRVQLQRLIEICQRLVVLSIVAVGNATSHQNDIIVGVALQRLGKVANSCIVLVQTVERASTPMVRFDIVRIESKRFGEVIDGALKERQVEVDLRASEVCLEGGWIGTDRLGVAFDCLPKATACGKFIGFADQFADVCWRWGWKGRCRWNARRCGNRCG